MKKLSQLFDLHNGPQELSSAAAEAAADKVAKVETGVMDVKDKRHQRWRAYVKKDLEKPRAILKAPFARLCRDILKDLRPDFRIGDGAVDCVHQAAEAAMVQTLAEANIVMEHAQRVELYPRDIRVLKKLRPLDITFANWEPVGPDAPRARAGVTAGAGQA